MARADPTPRVLVAQGEDEAAQGEDERDHGGDGTDCHRDAHRCFEGETDANATAAPADLRSPEIASLSRHGVDRPASRGGGFGEVRRRHPALSGLNVPRVDGWHCIYERSTRQAAAR